MGWIKDRDPEVEGHYITARGYSEIVVGELSYTPKHGWNTSTDSSGFINPETSVGYTGEGYVKAWMPMPEYKED